jgi:hypothetical protein
MPRKTTSVAEVLERVNTALQSPESMLRLTDMHNEPLSPEQAYRLGMAMVLEQILHSTGNYAGFRYQDVDHTVDPPVIPDETRRQYYPARSLG